MSCVGNIYKVHLGCDEMVTYYVDFTIFYMYTWKYNYHFYMTHQKQIQYINLQSNKCS